VFFFQAEDGIRGFHVTGVQTCALPILVASQDGTLAALLGASPGASIAVKAMIDVIERCFKDRIEGDWRNKMREMIPSYGESLVEIGRASCRGSERCADVAVDRLKQAHA